jgi:hypothetical protein
MFNRGLVFVGMAALCLAEGCSGRDRNAGPALSDDDARVGDDAVSEAPTADASREAPPQVRSQDATPGEDRDRAPAAPAPAETDAGASDAGPGDAAGGGSRPVDAGRSDAVNGDGGGVGPANGGFVIEVDGGVSPADGGPGGRQAVAAYCNGGCQHQSDCAAAMDAGVVDVLACVRRCESSQESTVVVLYRSDYWVSLTSCVASASCKDVLYAHPESACSDSALLSITPAAEVGPVCEGLFCDPTCATAACTGCLSSYKVLGDPTLQSLLACVSAPSYCSDPDAGAGCVSAALTPR